MNTLTQQQINQYQWQAADGVAKPVNPFKKLKSMDLAPEDKGNINPKWEKHEIFWAQNFFASNAPDGIYSGEAFELIDQYETLSGDWTILDRSVHKVTVLNGRVYQGETEWAYRLFLRLKSPHLPAVLTTQPGDEWKERYREVWYYRYWVYADWTEALYSDYVKFKTYADFEVYYKTEMNYYTKREWHLITPLAEQEAETEEQATKDSIIENMTSEMPYHLNENIKPYIKEAMDLWAKRQLQQLQFTLTQKDQRIAEFEREAEQLKDKLIEINNLCGTVNFSSHNQMREAIEGAVELSELPTPPQH